jgi:predicted DNA-binding transcriptional regulator
MSRDQVYGGLIFVISLLVAVGYAVAYFAPYLALAAWLHEWAVGIPVLLFVLLVLVISMWIGWTMLTTPPPEPIEPLETIPPASSTERSSKDEATQ